MTQSTQRESLKKGEKKRKKKAMYIDSNKSGRKRKKYICIRGSLDKFPDFFLYGYFY